MKFLSLMLLVMFSQTAVAKDGLIQSASTIREVPAADVTSCDEKMDKAARKADCEKRLSDVESNLRKYFDVLKVDACKQTACITSSTTHTVGYSGSVQFLK